VVPVQDWLDSKYPDSLDFMAEIGAGAGCAMPMSLQYTYDDYCYDQMCPASLWEGGNLPPEVPATATPSTDPTSTPSPSGCAITLTATPKYIMPGTRSTIALQATWSDGRPIANAPVDYYVSRGPGSVGGGSPVTDAQGRLNFDYYAPQDVGGSTSAKVAVTVGGCTTMTTVEIIFGPSPTPTQTHTPTPTIMTGTPTSTPTPTTTPTPPMPVAERPEGDLSLDRIVVLQAVEGAQLVGGRDVGVRVFLNWTGSQPAQVEVQATIDDLQLRPVIGEVKATYADDDLRYGRDAVNLVLNWEQRPPASGSPYWNLFPQTVDSDHKLEITVRLISVGGTQLANPTMLPPTQVSFRTKGTRALNLLFVSTNPKVNLALFESHAVRYLRKVYPVFDVRGVSWGEVAEQGSAIGTAQNVEIIRNIHNDQRCRAPDGSRISPCSSPWAGYAVGVFYGYPFGGCIEGAMFGRGSYAAKDFIQQFTLGSLIYRSVLVRDKNAWNTAHELGHSFDLEDEYEPGVRIGIQIPPGTSIKTGNNRFQTLGATPKYYNFMGNACITGGCDGCTVIDNTWVSPSAWNQILQDLLGVTSGLDRQVASLNGIGLPGLVDEPEVIEAPALLISGVVDPEGHVNVEQIHQLRTYEAFEPLDGDWILEALDESGNSLGRLQTNLVLVETDEDVAILEVLPVTDLAKLMTVRITKEGEERWSLNRSPSAPTVSINALPSFGDGPATLSWDVQDADGDALRSMVLFSADGGQTWRVMGTDLVGTSLDVAPEILVGGEAYFRVVVSDGLNETESVAGPVTIPDRAPMVNIFLPEGDQYAEGDPIYLEGYAIDPEDGEAQEAQYQWQEAGKSLGTGSEIVLDDLSHGEHRIVLAVSDTAGHRSQAEVSITVTASAKDEEMSSSSLAKDLFVGGLIASSCGLVLVVAGFALVLVFARKKTWGKVALIVLAIFGVTLAVAVPLLVLVMPKADETEVVSGLQQPTAAMAVNQPTSNSLVTQAPTEFPSSTHSAVTPSPTSSLVPPSPTPSMGAPSVTPKPVVIPSSWRIELVDPGEHVGEYPSLALSADGLPRISYSRYSTDGTDSDYDLGYVWFDGAEWQVETADSEGLAGLFTSLALDGDDQPHISYYDIYMGHLMYATSNPAGWETSVLDNVGYKVGRYSSLAVDSQNRPHISYREDGSGDLRYIHYVGPDAESPWVGEVVHQDGDVGEFASLALDSSDHPHISYYDLTNGQLFYAYHDGVDWNRIKVDSTGNVGTYTALALDGEDHPHIAYYDVDNQDLKYASFDGVSWQITTVDSEGDVGQSASMALDSAGRPHISYYDLTRQTLKYAVYTGTEWHSEIVGDIGNVRGREGTSIALDSSDQVGISYYTSEGLKYALGLVGE
jgi:hypothetical protein